jgi:hypothetical protein
MARRSSTLALVAAASAAALAPAGAEARLLHAGSAHRRATGTAPVVKRVAPHRVRVGSELHLRGRNFRPGRNRNSVVFRRAHGRYVFVKARLASTRHLWVTVPRKLTRYMAHSHGKAVATRFRLSVVGRRYGAHFTSHRWSPVVLPPRRRGTSTGSGPGDGGGGTSAPPAVCGVGLPSSGDHDSDGLTNAWEGVLHTDPCRADTDADGLSDYWEYRSALDYNASALPYPGTRPYTNPLDPSDADIDHDGDGLTARREYAFWARWGSKGSGPLFRSDGKQSSAGVVTVAPGDAWAHLDINHDGVLTDDERDSDLGDVTGRHGDGLGDWDEAAGRMTPQWWAAIITDEKPYGLSEYEPTDYLRPDTDGDGVLDGADDVDHDGYTNAFEVSREVYWNQPFNPCLPNPVDPPVDTCSLHPPPAENAWPPFDQPWNPAWTTPLRMSDVFGG